MKKRLLSVLLVLVMVLSLLPAPALAADYGYTDTAGHWGESSIDRWTNENVVQGVGDGSFNPDGLTSRAEAAQIFVNLFRLTETADISEYTDVPSDAWYTDAISKCMAAGILQGDGSAMHPTDLLSREQMFVMVGRSLGVKEDTSSSSTFTDSGDISEWAVGYTNTLANMGVLKGVGGGALAPLDEINRASVMAVLDRMIGSYITEDGEYPAPESGIVLIVAGEDVALTGDVDGKYITIAGAGVEVDLSGADGKSSIVITDAADGVVITGAAVGTTVTAPENSGATVNGVEVAGGDEYIVPDTSGDKPTKPDPSPTTPSAPEKPVMPEVDLNEYGLTEEVEDGVILHVWTWKHSTVKDHIPEIAAAGYSAIQTSPIAGGGSGSNNSISSWASLYNPGTITIGNSLLGSEEDFKALVEEAHKYGVKVIVDVVINHNRGLDNDDRYDWAADPGPFADPDHPWAHATRFDWYRGTMQWNENDRLRGTLGPQVNRDLNTQNPAVQQAMLDYLVSCVEAGADGFRFDAMRSVELPKEYPVEGYEDIDFSSDYLPIIIQNGASFQYGETLQGNPPSYADWTEDYDDSGNTRMGDYQALTFTFNGEERHLKTTLSFYGQRLRESISKGTANAEYMANMMVNKGGSAEYTVTWVESHDNYVNDKSYVSMDEQNVIQAWAILAARQNGTPLYYSRPLNSTISNVYGDNDNTKPGSPSFKDPQVVAVNFFHNEMGDAEEYLSNPIGTDDVIMIERGNAGAVIVNLRTTDLVLDNAPVVNMADGTYDENVYGGTFTVKDGKISGTVKAGRVAVVYNSQVNTSLEVEPSVYLLPTSTNFYSGTSASGVVYPETMNAYPSLANVDHATYHIDRGNEIAIQDGDAIVIGQNMDYGDSVTVTVTGYDAEGNVVGTASATYTKIEFTGSSVRLSDTNAQNRGWSQPYVYAWGADGEAFGGWPGIAMELQADGYWFALVPDEYALSSWNIIFNDNNGSQFDAGALGASEHRVYNADRRWVPYEEGMTDPSAGDPGTDPDPGPGTDPEPGDEEITVVYVENGYQGWKEIAVHAWVEGLTPAINTEPWPGIVAELQTEGKWAGYWKAVLPDKFEGQTEITVIINNNNNGSQVDAGTMAWGDTKVMTKDGKWIDASDLVVETTVYVENGYQDWKEIAVHAWVEGLTPAINTEPWPGIVAELQTEGKWAGYWKAVLPDKFEGQTEITVIINNNNNGSQVDAGTMAWGDTKVMTKDGRWINASELTDEPDEPEVPDEYDPGVLDVDLTENGLAKEVEDGAILHVWDWSFNAIKEMIPQIAAAGFSAIQTSPINEVLEGDPMTSLWYYLYRPTNYTIGNCFLGTEEEFKAMVEEAHKYGVKVIVDQVLNHVAPELYAVSEDIINGNWGTEADFGDYPFVNENGELEGWRHKNIGWNADSRTNGTIGWMSNELVDWNTHNPYVQRYMLDWLKVCVEAGADGFRYDAAKHIELPTDPVPSDFWLIVLDNGSSYQYGEVLGGPNDYKDLTYTTADGTEKNLGITVDNYGKNVRNNVRNKRLTASTVAGWANGTTEYDVTWVESHDNYCNESSYNTLNDQQVIQAWAILAARKDGTPLFYSRPNHSSAANPFGDNEIGPAGSPFYMDDQVAAVNFFRNEMNGLNEKLTNPISGNNQVLMIERGNAGAVIVNTSGSDAVLDGAASVLADGVYHDQVTGDEFTVADGKISGTVAASRVAVVYESKFEDQRVPGIYLPVPSSEFAEDATVTVTVTFWAVDHATYTFDGVNETPIANGETITFGSDVEVNGSITLTVIGYDADGKEVVREKETYKKLPYNRDTIVYLSDEYVQNLRWSNVYCYVYGGDEIKSWNNGTWPGQKMTLLREGDMAGYWIYVMPFELERLDGHKIIFNNYSGSQFNANESAEGEELEALDHGEQKVWTADGRWILVSQLSDPAVHASPAGGIIDGTLTVTLHASHVDRAAYKLGDGAETPYTDGATITIGEGVEPGASVTLTLTGYYSSEDGEKTVTAAYTYTKADWKRNTTIYVDPASYPNWTEFAVYIYNETYNDQYIGDDNVPSWPGVKLTEMNDDGYYVYQLPDERQGQSWKVIINNNNHGSQDSERTIKPDEQKLLTADQEWIDYVPETVVYVEAGFRGWEEIAVHAWTNSTNTAPWPGIPAVLQTEGKWAGYWKVVLPDKFKDQTNINIIINNNKPDGPEKQQEPDVQMDWGEKKVMTKGGDWVYASELTDEPEDPDDPKDPETETIIYVSDEYRLAQGWTAETMKVHIHAWNPPAEGLAEGTITTAWPGIEATLQEEGEWAGYWKVSLPANQFKDMTGIKLIVDNGSSGTGNQYDIGTINWGETKVLTEDGRLIDASELTTPRVYAMPEISDFYTSELEITLRAYLTADGKGKYQVNGGAETEYTDGETITIGKDVANEGKVTLTLTGTGKNGEPLTATFTYTKHFNEGAKTVRVLFVGNSYTYYNDGVWTHFQKLANAAGYNAVVDSVTIGSHRFDQYADFEGDEPAGGPLLKTKLENNHYDFVFLQEHSTAPLTNYSRTEKGAQDLYDAIMELQGEDCEVILYQTWGRKTGNADLTSNGRGWTNETMTYDLRYAYAALGEKLGVRVSPVGTAFYDVYSNNGDKVDIYDGDMTHPKLPGTYLASLIHFATVFSSEDDWNDLIDAAVAGYTAGLPAATIEILAQAAKDAPENDAKPHVYVTPANVNSFTGKTLDIILHAVNVENPMYQIDGGEAKPYKHLDTITIGEGVASGSTITVKLTGDNVDAATFTYTKESAPYLVIGWYENNGLSGLTEENVAVFVEALKAYLATQGATEDDLNSIVVRPYVGINVATLGSNVKADGDVDILIGVGDNVDVPNANGATAGLEIITKAGDITIVEGGKSRYTALLTKNEAAITVYQWIKATYGPKYDLVIGWYALTGTSGLDTTNVAAFTEALKEFLKTNQSVSEDDLDRIVLRPYDGNVATISAAINADGDVDILIGVGNNIDNSGNVTGVLAKDGNIGIGSINNRYIARLSDEEIVKTVYEWIKTTYGPQS